MSILKNLVTAVLTPKVVSSHIWCVLQRFLTLNIKRESEAEIHIHNVHKPSAPSFLSKEWLGFLSIFFTFLWNCELSAAKTQVSSRLNFHRYRNVSKIEAWTSFFPFSDNILGAPDTDLHLSLTRIFRLLDNTADAPRGLPQTAHSYRTSPTTSTLPCDEKRWTIEGLVGTYNNVINHHS